MKKNIKKKIREIFENDKIMYFGWKIIIDEISVCVIVTSERFECESAWWEKDSQLSQKRLL